MTGITKYSAEHAAAREHLLDGAVAAGKFSDARRTNYAVLYDVDPDYAAKLIAKMEPALPVEARRAVPPSDAYEASWLSPRERKSVTAAQSGAHPIIQHSNE